MEFLWWGRANLDGEFGYQTVWMMMMMNAISFCFRRPDGEVYVDD